VRFVLLQHVEIVARAERHLAPVEPAEHLDDRIKHSMHPRRQPLDTVVEIHPRAVHHRRFLEHLLDPHVHVVAVKLKTPLRKRLRPRVVAAAGAGCEDEDANLGHSVR
jgi:hypothetical protein